LTYCDVYLGRLDDPSFSWDEGDWNGNIPIRRSPFFPLAGLGYAAPFRVIHRIEEGKYDGKQTDWGGWVARVTRMEVIELIRDLHVGNGLYTSDTSPHLKQELRDLLRYVLTLDPEETIALVASEL
jgi:hypothetical protein